MNAFNSAGNIFAIEIEGIPQSGALKDVQFPSRKRPAIEIAAGAELKKLRTVGQQEIGSLKFSLALAAAKGPIAEKVDLLLSRETEGGKKLEWVGALHRCNIDGTILETCEFQGGLLNSIDFGKLDATAKDGGWMTIEFTPQDFKMVKGSGKAKSAISVNQKSHQMNNFRVLCGQGIDCTGVISVEGAGAKQTLTWEPSGESPLPELIAHGIEVNKSVKIAVKANKIDGFREWANIVDTGKLDERSFTVELLDTELKNTLLTINLVNCSLLELQAPKVDATKTEGARYIVDVLPEDITFVAKG